MKRFRILNVSDDHIEFSAKTTIEIFKHLKSGATSIDSYLIHDIIDDIKVSETEFMEAFKEGELPGDLQYF